MSDRIRVELSLQIVMIVVDCWLLLTVFLVNFDTTNSKTKTFLYRF